MYFMVQILSKKVKCILWFKANVYGKKQMKVEPKCEDLYYWSLMLL